VHESWGAIINTRSDEYQIPPQKLYNRFSHAILSIEKIKEENDEILLNVPLALHFPECEYYFTIDFQ